MATMPARTGSGSSAHASTTARNSGSDGVSPVHLVTHLVRSESCCPLNACELTPCESELLGSIPSSPVSRPVTPTFPVCRLAVGNILFSEWILAVGRPVSFTRRYFPDSPTPHGMALERSVRHAIRSRPVVTCSPELEPAVVRVPTAREPSGRATITQWGWGWLKK